MVAVTAVTTLLATIAFAPPGPASASAAAPARSIAVLLDSIPVEFDVPPMAVNGRTLVPFRAIAEALGATVGWDQATGTARASLDGIEVIVPLDSCTAMRDGAPLSLDVPARTVGQRILMPLRFFAEAFGCRVDWDQAAYSVIIASPRRPMEVLGFYALGDSKTPSWTDVFGTAYPETSTGNTDLLRTLALGWYSLDQQGNLLTASTTGWQRPDGWEQVLAAADRYNLRTELVVHMTDGNGQLSGLLRDDAAVKAAAEGIAAEAVRIGSDGVNLDLEGLGFREQGAELEATRGRLNRFVETLEPRLRAAGKGLTVTVHAPNSAYPGYDLATLGRLADRLVVMAYDYGPRPEPIELVRAAIAGVLAVVPADRVLLGLSAASENPQSLVVKVGLAKRYRLAGIAVWRLGIVSDDDWAALRTTIEPR